MPDVKRQEINQEFGKIRMDGFDAEQKIKARNNKAENLGDINRGPAHQCLDEGQPVDDTKLRLPGKGAAASPHDLHEAKAPSAALGDVLLESFRGQSQCQTLVQ